MVQLRGLLMHSGGVFITIQIRQMYAYGSWGPIIPAIWGVPHPKLHFISQGCLSSAETWHEATFISFVNSFKQVTLAVNRSSVRGDCVRTLDLVCFVQ